MTTKNPEGIVIHTDAVWKAETKHAGLGWIYSDATGETTYMNSKTEEFVSSALVAEGLTIREAMLQARQMGFSTFTIYSDVSQSYQRQIYS